MVLEDWNLQWCAMKGPKMCTNESNLDNPDRYNLKEF